MNSKDLARNIALAAAMIGIVPMAALCNLAEPAAGADFGQPFPGLATPAPLDDRVQFASNWYVRGDLAYAQETLPTISPVLNTFSANIGGGIQGQQLVPDGFDSRLSLAGPRGRQRAADGLPSIGE